MRSESSFVKRMLEEEHEADANCDGERHADRQKITSR